ncbi:MAG: hypothetical protein H0X56_07725 [Solirubrobacterales bacterium]|nr:hypothetical protein [Solirubrobacterales bacterium]
MRLTRAGPLGLAVLTLSVVAALMMIAAEALPLWEVEVADFSCAVLATEPAQADECITYGVEQHALGLALVGVLVALMGAGAALGPSRPAAIALCCAGVVVLALVIAFDVPAARSTGAIGLDYQEARAEARIGLLLEILGGALAVGAGALFLWAGGRAGSAGSRGRERG